MNTYELLKSPVENLARRAHSTTMTSYPTKIHRAPSLKAEAVLSLFVRPRMYGSNSNGPDRRSDNRGRARWGLWVTG